ncbi:hypothetical protein OKHIF_21940 [Mycobacteroides chelonae]
MRVVATQWQGGQMRHRMRRLAALLAAGLAAMAVLHCSGSVQVPLLTAGAVQLGAPIAAAVSGDADYPGMGSEHSSMHCLPAASVAIVGDGSGIWSVSDLTLASSASYRPLETPGLRAPPRPAQGGGALMYRLCVIRR